MSVEYIQEFFTNIRTGPGFIRQLFLKKGDALKTADGTVKEIPALKNHAVVTFSAIANIANLVITYRQVRECVGQQETIGLAANVLYDGAYVGYAVVAGEVEIDPRANVLEITESIDPAAADVYDAWSEVLWFDLPCHVLTCTIADEGTVSDEVDLRGNTLAAIYMSAGWDAADLTIHAAPVASGTFYPVYDHLGAALVIKAVAAHVVTLDTVALGAAPLRYIKLVASAAQTTAARTLTLICKE